MTVGEMASTKPPLSSSVAWNRSRLQPLYTVGKPASLVLQKHRSLNRRSFAKKRSEDTSSGCIPAVLPSGCRDPRHHTSWLWAEDGPPTGRLCGWVEPLASVDSTWENRLSRKKKDVPSNRSQAFTPSPSAKDRITREALTVMTSIRCSSVVLMTLCLHLTSRHDRNTAAAPCNLAVNDNEIRVMSMCCYPQCGLGPDTPGRNSSCLVSCHPQSKLVLRAREANRPCPMGSLIVWTCAAHSSEDAPLSEAAPFSEELTGVSLLPVSSRPSAVSGTIRDIFLRRVDPPRNTDVKGKVPVRIRSLIQSCTTGLKGVVPIRKVIQSCAAGAPGSKGVVPIRRVNRSCTTKCEGEREELILIGLPSRPESRCSERDPVKRIRMPSDAPEIGARRGRNRCAEREVFPSPHGLWAWQDRRDWNCVAGFVPLWHDCRDLNRVIAVTVEQSDLVSSLLYNSIHLFSPHPDLTVTDLLRWKGATLLYQLKSRWETQEPALRAPRGSDHTPTSPGAIVTATILPEFPFTNTPLLPAPDLTATPRASSSLGDMGLRTSLCVLLMGLVIPSSTHHVYRSATLGSLMGLLSVVPAERFTFQNG